MYVGVDMIIHLVNGIYHTARFLCGGSIVEVYQRMLVHLAFQYGEILTVHVLVSDSVQVLFLKGLCLVVAEAAALAGIEFTAETVFDKVRNLFAKFLVGDILQDVADEGML